MWGHNKERGRRGENLFAITDEGVDVPLAVEEWHHEREHYNFSTSTCDAGQMCGHYTQVRGPGGGTPRLVGGAGGAEPPVPSPLVSLLVRALRPLRSFIESSFHNN